MTRGLGQGKLRRAKTADGRTVYVGDWVDAGGKRHRQAFGADKGLATKRLAQEILHRDRVLAGLELELSADLKLADLCSRFLEHAKTTSSASHYRNLANRLPRVIEAIGAARVRDIRAEEVDRYVAERMDAKRANSTINGDVHALRAMLTWAVGRRIISWNPLDRVRPLPVKLIRHRRAMTEAEVERFLAAAATQDQEHPEAVPQLPLWTLLVERGPRFGETVAMRWADVDLAAATATLRAETTKGGRERKLPLSDRCVAQLKALQVRQAAQERIPPASAPVFLRPDAKPWETNTGRALRLLHAILDRAEIKHGEDRGGRLDVHALRATAASTLARRNMPVATLQKLLGHRTVQVTLKHYVHVGTEDIRSAILSAERQQSGSGEGSPKTDANAAR